MLVGLTIYRHESKCYYTLAGAFWQNGGRITNPMKSISSVHLIEGKLWLARTAFVSAGECSNLGSRPLENYA